MQNQQQAYLKYQAKNFSQQNYTISQQQLKQTLRSIINKLTQLQSPSPPSTGTTTGTSIGTGTSSTGELVQKIQYKIIEMEERRRAWDDTMAEIFNDRKDMENLLKNKITQIQDIEVSTRVRLESMEKFVSQKLESIEEDKNNFRRILTDKIEKAKKQFHNDLQQKYAYLKQSLEDQYKKKLQSQFKFTIKCSQLANPSKGQKNSDIDSHPSSEYQGGQQGVEGGEGGEGGHSEEHPSEHEDLKQSARKGERKEEIKEDLQIQNNREAMMQGNDDFLDEDKKRLCQNMEVIVSNFNSLESLQFEIKQLTPTIERFQKKMMKMGQKIQVIENKLADTMEFQKNESKAMLEKQQQLSPSIKMVKSEYSKPINSSQSQSLSQSSSQSQFQPHQPLQPQSMPLSFYLMSTGLNFRDFLLEDNIITYVQRTNADSSKILLGSQYINIKPYFTVKIVSTSKNYLSFGIVDKRYAAYKDCWERENFIMMRAVAGEVYSGPKEKIRETGVRFNVGDQVRVQVNLAEFSVNWLVNGVLRAVYKSNKLQDKGIIWVPLMRFYNRFDSIKWIG